MWFEKKCQDNFPAINRMELLMMKYAFDFKVTKFQIFFLFDLGIDIGVFLLGSCFRIIFGRLRVSTLFFRISYFLSSFVSLLV